MPWPVREGTGIVKLPLRLPPGPAHLGKRELRDGDDSASREGDADPSADRRPLYVMAVTPVS